MWQHIQPSRTNEATGFNLYGLHDPPVGQAPNKRLLLHRFTPLSYHYVEASLPSSILRAEGFSEQAPPVPIPNTAVTLSSADGTALRAEA